MNKYVNSGGLWMRHKRSPKSPDMTGDITIGGDVLEHIKNELRAGATEIKLSTATWRAMQTPSGPNYNLKVSIPMNRDQQQGGGYGNQRQQGGYGQQRGGYGNQRQDGYQQGGGYAPQDNRGGYGNQRQQQRDMYDQQEQNNQQGDYQRNDLNDEIPF